MSTNENPTSPITSEEKARRLKKCKADCDELHGFGGGFTGGVKTFLDGFGGGANERLAECKQEPHLQICLLKNC